MTRAIVFLLIFGTIVGASHNYIVGRLVLEPMWPEAATWMLSATMWTGAALLVLLPFSMRGFPARTARFVAWPGYMWMGIVFYLLVLTGLSELVMWWLSPASLDTVRLRVVAVASATFVITVLGLAGALRTPRVKRVEIAMANWPKALDGYRIVQISDVHIGSLLRAGFARRLVDRCNGLQADLIAITGDLVDGSLADLRDQVAPFAALAATDGVFFATGNHDHYAGATEWSDFLDSLGLKVLRNTHVTLERGDCRFVIGGVYDRSSSAGDDVGAAFAEAPAGIPRILLAHHPETFRKATHFGVDLQLSGHTHAGQLYPFRYLVHLQTRFIDGLHRLGPHALYVSRGTGFWGPPMRVLAPAEITELFLRPAG